VGTDGSGKTTQANLLMQKLRTQGNTVKYVHFFSSGRMTTGILQTRSLLDTFVKSVDKPTNGRLRVFIRVWLRLMGVLFDSWLTHFVNAFKYRGQIILYDRYYYDSLVALAFRNRTLTNQILTLSKLIPKPNIAILFEVTPSTSVKRKAEHTMNDAERISNLYLKLKTILPINTLNAELSIKQVRQHIAKICEEI